MATRREYLVEKGLASPGRGRFSKIAKEAIRVAELDGVKFDEDTPTAKPAARTPKADKQTAVPISKSRKTPVRTEDKVWGRDENGIVISLGDCANGHSVKMCDCKDGPVLPKWLGGGVGLLEKPA